MYRSLPAGLETVRYLVQEEQRTSEGSINRFFHRQERTEDRHNDRRVSMIDVRERVVSPKVENGILSADVDYREKLQGALNSKCLSCRKCRRRPQSRSYSDRMGKRIKNKQNKNVDFAQ